MQQSAPLFCWCHHQRQQTPKVWCRQTFEWLQLTTELQTASKLPGERHSCKQGRGGAWPDPACGTTAMRAVSAMLCCSHLAATLREGGRTVPVPVPTVPQIRLVDADSQGFVRQAVSCKQTATSRQLSTAGCCVVVLPGCDQDGTAPTDARERPAGNGSDRATAPMHRSTRLATCHMGPSKRDSGTGFRPWCHWRATSASLALQVIAHPRHGLELLSCHYLRNYG